MAVEIQPPARFHPGQQLRAYDLQSLLKRENQLRWWHTVALHNVWGIAEGLRVSRTADEDVVQLKPGLAYDVRGRELLFSEKVIVPVPVDDLPAVLVAHHSTQAGSIKNIPDLSWRKPNNVRRGLEVELVHAQLIPSGRVRILKLDHRVRPYGQPVLKPYMAAGRTNPGLGWQRWPEEGEQYGWSISVDTSGAGFYSTPNYFAAFEGNILAEDPDEESPQLCHFCFINAGESSRIGFTFVVYYAALSGARPDSFYVEPPDLPVSWIGIEPELACGSSISVLTQHIGTHDAVAHVP